MAGNSENKLISAEVTLSEMTSEAWDVLIDRSPGGSIFQKSAFITAYGQPVRYFSIYFQKQAVAGICLPQEGGTFKIQHFQAFNGVVFDDLASQKTYKQIEIRFAVMEFLAATLFEKYRGIQIAHHWDVQDVRAFDWFNYHDRSKGHYQIQARYTSLLDITPDRLQAGLKDVRVTSLKTSKKFNLKTVESQDIGILDRLHELTFKRQGIDRPQAEGDSLKALCASLMQAGAGKLYVTDQDGQPTSACFLAIDSKRATYLFGASDPEARKTETGTRNLLDAFAMIFETKGIKEVDLAGVNSPQRGGFKLSLGGRIVPYFQTTQVS